jgi:hypothetical protein
MGTAIMFWKNTKNEQLEAIREGSLFQRKHPHNMLETARVLSIEKDQFGIPHVKYEVKFERAQERGRAFEGPRVLALAVFADNFRQTAEAV